MDEKCKSGEGREEGCGFPLVKCPPHLSHVQSRSAAHCAAFSRRANQTESNARRIEWLARLGRDTQGNNISHPGRIPTELLHHLVELGVSGAVPGSKRQKKYLIHLFLGWCLQESLERRMIHIPKVGISPSHGFPRLVKTASSRLSRLSEPPLTRARDLSEFPVVFRGRRLGMYPAAPNGSRKSPSTSTPSSSFLCLEKSPLGCRFPSLRSLTSVLKSFEAKN